MKRRVENRKLIYCSPSCNRYFLCLSDTFDIIIYDDFVNSENIEIKIANKSVMDIAIAAVLFKQIENYVPHAFLTADPKRLLSGVIPSFPLENIMAVKKTTEIPIIYEVSGYMTDDFMQEHNPTDLQGLSFQVGKSLLHPVVSHTSYPKHITKFRKLIMHNYCVAVYCACRDFLKTKGFILSKMFLRFGNSKGKLVLMPDSLFVENMLLWKKAKYDSGKIPEDFLFSSVDRYVFHYPDDYLALSDIEKKYQILYKKICK